MENPLKYKIELTWPDYEEAEFVKMERNGLTEQEARELITYYREKADDKLKGMIDGCMRSFGTAGHSQGKYSVAINAYRDSIPTLEEFECPRRAEMFNQVTKPPDHWNKIGKDRTCSYCGSLHPDSVLDIIKEHGPQQLENSTKGYKFYVERPDTVNAGQGGIKYYRQHDTPEFIEELNRLLKQIKP